METIGSYLVPVGGHGDRHQHVVVLAGTDREAPCQDRRGSGTVAAKAEPVL